ncbi:MAG: CRISPR-associated protein Csx11, partial [Anaerolineae bacterium]|nr:CRISPR-associated protein Csx11 [Anaerolineae bacterium]
MSQLDILLQHRQALLLAEMAALLHDMGKCSDEHIINQASDKLQGLSYKYKTAQSHRLPASPTDISLLGETVSLEDLIEKGMPKIISDSNNPWLLRVLGRCHSAAHIEKELSDRDTATKQPKDDTRLSTAYGIEGNAVKGLTALLDTLPFNNLTNRASFFPEAKKAFSQSLADTRRPINEVTLADWSEVVAALYKSALAGALLGIKPDPDDLHWRLLRVNFDVLALYAKAVKIADLLAYQNAVEEACAKIKQLVEEEYPLGNEIYRDTSGIYFTFPDFDLP